MNIEEFKQNLGGSRLTAYKNPLVLRALGDFMTTYLNDKKAFKNKKFYLIVEKGNCKYAHFIDIKVTIYIFDEKVTTISHKHVENIFSFNLCELYGNCSTVMFHNLETPSYHYSDIPIVLSFIEELSILFGFTKIMYTTSEDVSSNKALSKTLIKSYKIIDEFKNTRGGLIKFWSKSLVKIDENSDED